MWIIYGMMAVLALCWVLLLMDIIFPGWDRD